MKEVIVENDGKQYKVRMGKIKYGKMIAIMQKYFRTTAQRDGLRADIEHFNMLRDIVVASIIDIEPKVDDIEKFVNELPYEEGKKLEDVALELNPL